MAQRFNFPREQVFSDLGIIGAGYKLYTYETGTSTPLATYSDTALSSANANPTIADSAGRFSDIFVNDLNLYKAVLKDDDDNTIYTADPVDPKTFTIDDFDPRPTSFWGTTAGTSSAYTLTADPVVTSYSSNQTFFLAFHTACAASPTLTYVSGGSVLNLKKSNGLGGKVALEANDVLTGTYEARNDGTDIIILNPEKPYLNIDRCVRTDNLIDITYGTDADHDINFNPGSNLSSDGTVNIILGSTYVKQLDATWAAGSAAGGLADGLTIANNTTYYCFALSSPDGVTVGAGFDTDPTASNLIAGALVVAAGLSKYARVGVIQTDGSANIKSTFLGKTTKGGQKVFAYTAAHTTTTTAIPKDDSIPQNTEGVEFLTATLAPLNASKRLLITVSGPIVGSTNGVHTTVALFRDSTADALIARGASSATEYIHVVSFEKEVDATSTSATTFKLRFGPDSATSGINGSTSGRLYGGVSIFSITIEEY